MALPFQKELEKYKNIDEDELLGKLSEEELKQLEPYGQGNEKPLFAQKKLYIRSKRVLGKTKNLVKMNLVTESGLAMDGLLFTNGDEFLEEIGNKKWIDVIYYPDINEYNGVRTLQIVIKNFQFCEGGN